MEGARPQAGRRYPVAPQYLPELNRQIEVLERAGIIRRSKSLYGAQVLFAPKKDGKLRLCIDYHKLNRQTLRDCYPTPVATDLIARTRGCKMFSKLDLHSGFHQLRIHEGDHTKQHLSHQADSTNGSRVPLDYQTLPITFSAS